MNCAKEVPKFLSFLCLYWFILCICKKGLKEGRTQMRLPATHQGFMAGFITASGGIQETKLTTSNTEHWWGDAGWRGGREGEWVIEGTEE